MLEASGGAPFGCPGIAVANASFNGVHVVKRLWGAIWRVMCGRRASGEALFGIPVCQSPTPLRQGRAIRTHVLTGRVR